MSADEPVFEKTYLISVEAPLRLGMDDLGQLVDVVADAAYAWAGTHKDRDWDLYIGGLPKDDATHSAEAAHERAENKVDALMDLLGLLWDYVLWDEAGPKLTDDQRVLITSALRRREEQS